MAGSPALIRFVAQVVLPFNQQALRMTSAGSIVQPPAPGGCTGRMRMAELSSVSPQVVPAGKQPWSLAQRGAAVGRNGVKLLGVGFGASMFGVTITNVLLEVRHRVGLLPECVACLRESRSRARLSSVRQTTASVGPDPDCARC